MTFHSVTHRALSNREIGPKELSFLLGCTQIEASDLISGRRVATARERAIVRLVASSRRRDLDAIRFDANAEYEWRPIPGFERYEASQHGQVRRADTGKVLAATKMRDGRLKVTLYDNGGKMTSGMVHVCVCAAFHGPRPKRLLACHKDDDHSNNTPDNLYWGTTLENAADMVRNRVRKQPNFHRPIGTNLAQSLISAINSGKISAAMARKIHKETMTYRLS